MDDQYWITGADGKEYGPVSLQVVTQWIREHRLIASSSVRKGDGPPMEADRYPELSGLFGASGFAEGAAPSGRYAPEPSTAAASGAPGFTPGTPIALPPEFRVWAFIGLAWNLVKTSWLHLAAMVLLLAAIGGFHRHLGCLVMFIIGGALMVGIFRSLLGLVDGRKAHVGMMFDGFDRFGDAFLGSLVSKILIALGLICLIVPGIILSIMWMFLYPVLAETRLGFWEAMRDSARLTEGYRGPLFLLLLADLLIILLGVAAFFVGLFVAMPVVWTSWVVAYRWLQVRKGRIAQPQAA
jgi:hypothetical protein